MVSRGIRIFFGLSIIYYLLLVFYLIFGFYSIRSNSLGAVSVSASRINSSIDSSFSIDYSFSSPYFKSEMLKAFEQYKRLKAALIYSEANGPEYIRITDKRLTDFYNPQAIIAGSEIPEFDSSSLFIKTYKSKLYFKDGYSATVILAFDVFDRGSVFPLLRNTIIAAVIHLIISIIVISTIPLRRSSGYSYEKEVTYNEDLPEAEEQILEEPPVVESLGSDFEPDIPEMPDDTELPIPDNIDESVMEQPYASPNQTAQTTPGMYSDRSGLVWEHFLPEKLDAELKRSASFDQDSCLVFISVISPSGFIPYRNISELIIEHFSYKDLAFEAGVNTFCVIIPEKDIDEGQIEVDKFKKSLKSRFPDSAYKISAGITSRNSRLLSEKRMIQEARAALSRAEAEDKSTTIAFRTDLNKYREYIASIT